MIAMACNLHHYQIKYILVLFLPCSNDAPEDKIDSELFMDVVPRSWIKSSTIHKGGGGAELQELSRPCTAEGHDDQSNA